MLLRVVSRCSGARRRNVRAGLQRRHALTGEVMITEEARTRLLHDKIEQSKAEILEDIESGRVPAMVRSFGDLHSYVDANCYGGMAEDDEADRLLALWGGPVKIGCMMDATPADLQALSSEVQDAVNAWLLAGRQGAERNGRAKVENR